MHSVKCFWVRPMIKQEFAHCFRPGLGSPVQRRPVIKSPGVDIGAITQEQLYRIKLSFLDGVVDRKVAGLVLELRQFGILLEQGFQSL